MQEKKVKLPNNLQIESSKTRYFLEKLLKNTSYKIRTEMSRVKPAILLKSRRHLLLVRAKPETFYYKMQKKF